MGDRHVAEFMSGYMTPRCLNSMDGCDDQACICRCHDATPAKPAIPDEWIEAAARAEFEADRDPGYPFTWSQALGTVQQAYRDRARAGLAAVLLTRYSEKADGPDAQASHDALPDIRAGIYRHYKGHHYLVLGYGHDSNYEGRRVVVYVGLELDDARPGPRLAIRTVKDFFAIVDPQTGDAKDYPHSSPDFPLRFTYVGPSWQRQVGAVVAHTISAQAAGHDVDDLIDPAL